MPRVLTAGPCVWQGEAAGVISHLAHLYHVWTVVLDKWGAVFLWAVDEGYKME